ncbi:MAG: 4Fe-4S binding protein, partial [Proteobacteria bacterium]|nr:4Fe-4S binding protein [Pseudomonadota bacterium]
MSKYYLFQDTKKCIGCHACEIQCKSNKNLPPGPKPCQVIPVGPKMI